MRTKITSKKYNLFALNEVRVQIEEKIIKKVVLDSR